MKPAVATAPPMAQINVRIDRNLKEAGDAVLAELGISPTQIVRDLWAKLSERKDSPQEVIELLRPRGRTAEEQAEIERKLGVVDQITTGYAAFAKAHGLSMQSIPRYDEDFDWTEAMWEERDERARERGLL